MIPLRVKGQAKNLNKPIVKQVTRSTGSDSSCVLLWEKNQDHEPFRNSLGALITCEPEAANIPGLPKDLPSIHGINRLDHLTDGDVVALYPNGMIETLFRKASPHNALFITDRCNSNCLMCSQPPKDRDDLDHLFDLNMQLLPFLPKYTGELGITGGEPTLLGERLYQLLFAIRQALPETEIHMLTNGRLFAWKKWAWKLAKIDIRRLMLGIPLYSDYPAHHDYIVQAKDAFSQTMLGLYNLARANQRIELRIVLHKATIQRLPQLARFIFKNLPFVEHVTFMGLEYTGYTPHNDSLLWIDPTQYVEELSDAVHFLDDFGMNVSIYNLQLCLIPEDLWQFSRNSISDWKRTYLEECNHCSKLEECGGVFATSRKFSTNIKAI